MDVIQTDRMFLRRWDATVSVMRLCHELGLPSFSDRVSETIADYIEVDHFSVFAIALDRPSRLLAAGSRAQGPQSSAIAKAYIERFSKADPVRTLLSDVCAAQGTLTCRNRPEDVKDLNYRRICYDDPQIAERLTVGTRQGDQWFSLNLYRLRGVAQFSSGELEAVMQVAACILPLLPRHAECESPVVRRPRQALPEFTERLRQLPCRLTRREVEVCARALIGMTAEGTALDLGIGITSVATYRKRAYQRLGISSQSELFAVLPDRLYQ